MHATRNVINHLHWIVSSLQATLVLTGFPVILFCNCAVKRCGPKSCTESMSGFRQKRSLAYRTYQHLQISLRGLRFFDYLQLLCDKDTCGAYVPGTKIIAYKDHHHLTVS